MKNEKMEKLQKQELMAIRGGLPIRKVERTLPVWCKEANKMLECTGVGKCEWFSGQAATEANKAATEAAEKVTCPE